MNALIRKEVRLLLPFWDAAMLLAAFPGWFCQPGDPVPLLAALVGMTILAVTSFGREFASGTFALLLAQPISRQKLWGVKLGVLFCALSLVCLTYILSNLQNFAGGGIFATPGPLALCVPLAMAGGFCSMLLIRQTIPALAFTALTPPAILLPGLLVLDLFRTPKTIATEALLGALALYSVGGILWSRRLFAYAQEVSATGGGASFVGLPFLQKHSNRSYIATRSSPCRALLGKEFHLHFTTLAGMAGLFVVHLLILVCRHLYAHSPGAVWEDLDAVLVWFGALWLLPPFFIAAASVADERRLGTMDAQLCLPASRRLQFTTKFLFSLLFGGFVSALLLFAAEEFGTSIGVRHDLIHGFATYLNPWERSSLSDAFVSTVNFNSGAFFLHLAGAACLLAVFLAVSCLAFYASTLASGILEALGLGAVLTFLGLAAYSTHSRDSFTTLLGIMLWGGPLILWTTVAVFSLTIIWLSWQNFGRWHERRRMWQTNVLGLIAAAMISTGLTAAIFHRTWELLLPDGPDRGPARLSPAQPPSFVRNGNGMAFFLPDGKLWLARLSRTNDWDFKLAGGCFIAGSDWADVAMPEGAIVAIRKDGTLWYSPVFYGFDFRPQEPAAKDKKPVEMARFGAAADWKKVIAFDRSALLLKTDGTLWNWGTGDEASVEKWSTKGPMEINWSGRSAASTPQEPWPGLDALGIQRVGTKSDWADLFIEQPPGDFLPRAYAKSANGREWVISSRVMLKTFDPASAETWLPGVHAYSVPPNWDVRGAPWKTMRPAFWMDRPAIGVRNDGAIGVLQRENSSISSTVAPRCDFVQLGRAADWRDAVGQPDPWALKADGTLWNFLLYSTSPIWLYRASPNFPGRWIKVGAHTDWIGFYESPMGILLLAPDGGIWRLEWKPVKIANIPWLPPFWLAPSRYPQPLGNLFTGDLTLKNARP